MLLKPTLSHGGNNSGRRTFLRSALVATFAINALTGCDNNSNIIEPSEALDMRNTTDPLINAQYKRLENLRVTTYSLYTHRGKYMVYIDDDALLIQSTSSKEVVLTYTPDGKLWNLSKVPISIISGLGSILAEIEQY